MTNSHQHCFNWFACDLNFLMSYLQVAQILCLILLLSDAFLKKKKVIKTVREDQRRVHTLSLCCIVCRSRAFETLNSEKYVPLSSCSCLKTLIIMQLPTKSYFVLQVSWKMYFKHTRIS